MADTGTLIVRTFTSRGELPVRNASISVIQHGPLGNDLLALQTSGRSGATAPIAIPSPAPETSQTPDQTVPYALCDIWVERAGYHLAAVHGVQIFPGVISYQDILLIPQSPVDGMAVNEVDITPQDL
ncbi:MAG: spore cortex-lytic protein [Ruminiclostridium sp.]|nr:spore cortex-lytic protein [Ruminiclostridium sp.]